jgi:hypothetical protein
MLTPPSHQQAKKPNFNLKFQKLAGADKCTKKYKITAHKSSEPIREDTYEFLENEDLMMVSSTTVTKQTIEKENEEKKMKKKKKDNR